MHRDGITVRGLRPATSSRERRAAGGRGRDAAGFGSLTAPKPQDDTGTGGNRPAKKARRQPGHSGWVLVSGLRVWTVPARPVPQSGRSLCPDPPAPPAWVSRASPVPSHGQQRRANHIVDVGLRVCTNQRSGRRSRAHTSSECSNQDEPPRTRGPEALMTQKYTMPS